MTMKCTFMWYHSHSIWTKRVMSNDWWFNWLYSVICLTIGSRSRSLHQGNEWCWSVLHQSSIERLERQVSFYHKSINSMSCEAFGWLRFWFLYFNLKKNFCVIRDKTHVDWVKAWIQVLVELQAFVKQHHTTGLTWNVKGKLNCIPIIQFLNLTWIMRVFSPLVTENHLICLNLFHLNIFKDSLYYHQVV